MFTIDLQEPNEVLERNCEKPYEICIQLDNQDPDNWKEAHFNPSKEIRPKIITDS